MRDRCCVHFNGIQNGCCKAGVSYREVVGGEEFGWATRLPCHIGAETECPARRLQTPGEYHDALMAQRKAFEQFMERMPIARSAIVAQLGEWTHANRAGGAGKMQCPICATGELSYSRAGCNGHIHASCSTEGCVSWVE